MQEVKWKSEKAETGLVYVLAWNMQSINFQSDPLSTIVTFILAIVSPTTDFCLIFLIKRLINEVLFESNKNIIRHYHILCMLEM